jgi:excisionase family DNA binding protein
MKQDSSTDEMLLDVPSTARALHIGPTYCRRLIKEGEIKSIRLGRRLLVPRSWLEQYIAERCGN